MGYNIKAMEISQKKILVVEDDKALMDILSDKLKGSFNYNILQAGDGEQAVAIIFSQKPDLVLLDLLLPKMDGFGVLEKIRKEADASISSIKVIILSNLWSNKDILRAKALMIDEYYVKANTNLDDVMTKVRGIMNSLPRTLAN
jgi:OmpR family response regulator RpaB